MDKPDYYIENFWLNFKVIMKNFYEQNNIRNERPIHLWSYELNTLQKKEDYNTIQNNIRNYMSLYAIDLMKFNDLYHTGILITNIKRWDKLSTKYNFEQSESKYHNIIFLLLDIYNCIMDYHSIELSNIFKQVELFIIYEDFSCLIKYAINNNKATIIDKLNSYKNINDFIKNNYNIEYDNNMSGKKILKLL